jgi:ribonuclease HII
VKKTAWIIGIDEAGRGPLAGPVAVGVAMVPTDFDWTLLPEVGDSKQRSPKKREALFGRASELRRRGAIRFFVAMESAFAIDRLGIAPTIRRAMARALRAALRQVGARPEEVAILLDGGLAAPAPYPNQRTIIKGDASEPIIGLASIIAKVNRDRVMTRLAIKRAYTCYGFALNKGYGTAFHRAAIKKYGLSDIHRLSFCRGLS